MNALPVELRKLSISMLHESAHVGDNSRVHSFEDICSMLFPLFVSICPSPITRYGDCVFHTFVPESSKKSICAEYCPGEVGAGAMFVTER